MRRSARGRILSRTRRRIEKAVESRSKRIRAGSCRAGELSKRLPRRSSHLRHVTPSAPSRSPGRHGPALNVQNHPPDVAARMPLLQAVARRGMAAAHEVPCPHRTRWHGRGARGARPRPQAAMLIAGDQAWDSGVGLGTWGLRSEEVRRGRTLRLFFQGDFALERNRLAADLVANGSHDLIRAQLVLRLEAKHNRLGVVEEPKARRDFARQGLQVL
jgi:hypothetical protein